MDGVATWEWIERGMLGLMITVMTWVVKDYLKLRTKILPQFITEAQCRTCREAKNQDMAEIRQRLEDGRREFKEISVFMARIDERLKNLDG